MNCNKEDKSLTFWRGSEVSQVKVWLFSRVLNSLVPFTSCVKIEGSDSECSGLGLKVWGFSRV